MPTTRKRIGYLPSPNTQERIKKIANKEKLSQSKVVGILVEEALIARGLVEEKNKTYSNIKNIYEIESNINDSNFRYNETDEMISDKGITYNTKKHKHDSKEILSATLEATDEELFEQFKKFILFQKIIREN